MAFKVQTVTLDLVNATASVVMFDQVGGSPPKVVNIQFPPPAAGKERNDVVAEAKRVLQQAVNEIV